MLDSSLARPYPKPPRRFSGRATAGQRLVYPATVLGRGGGTVTDQDYLHPVAGRQIHDLSSPELACQRAQAIGALRLGEGVGLQALDVAVTPRSSNYADFIHGRMF